LDGWQNAVRYRPPASLNSKPVTAGAAEPGSFGLAIDRGVTDQMATDYDAPRRGDVDELNEDSLEELKARRAEAQSGTIDVDEAELAESLELPGADLSSMSGEELTVRVLPKQDDEFTCSSCFLVHHRSRLAREKNGQLICRDCA
jgi:formylmethanofuran dehydrogenase subunit E